MPAEVFQAEIFWQWIGPAPNDGEWIARIDDVDDDRRRRSLEYPVANPGAIPDGIDRDSMNPAEVELTPLSEAHIVRFTMEES